MGNETNKELLYRIDERQREMNRHVHAIELHLKELNGTVAKNKNHIKAIAFALVTGSFVWIKESRDFILTLLKSII